MKAVITLGVWAGLALPAAAQAGQLAVTSVSPAAHSAAPVDTDILVDFDRALLPSSVTGQASSFHVFGEASGPVNGMVSFENGDQRVRFHAQPNYFAGETVRVTISKAVQAADGSPLRQAGYVFEFRAETAPAALDFAPSDGMSVRQMPTEAVRVYGGLGADFDDDGYIDLALINEDSEDCRMLMNRADGSGHFHDLSPGPDPLGSRPSPSRAADFDVDGIIDAVASNTESANVAVLLGLAGGDFAAAQMLPAAAYPRGLGVIELNGDGFIDIATANWTDGTGNVALILNNGQGGFLPAAFLDAGIVNEFALDTADMNNDGIQDLVVAGRESQSVTVLLAVGDGTFMRQVVRPTGGNTWRIQCGDLDGDGFMDVTTANGLSANAAVLLNDGTGNLGPPAVYVSAPFTTDTQLGDLDGDGDLDWVLSNFSGQTYKLFTNDGSGAFAFHTELDAINRPAGVVMMDFDNDLDLDLVLMDEIDDMVTFLENQSGLSRLLCFGDGSGTACPCANDGDPGHGCDNAQSTGGVNVAPTVVTSLGPGVGISELAATGFPPSGNGLIIPIRSTGTVNNGEGALLGDGLICLAAPVVRLKLAMSSYGTASVVVRHQIGAGAYYYQLVYRNQSATFCTPEQFNTSNTVQITWP